MHLLFTLGGILCLSSVSSKDGKLHSRVLETTPSAIRFPPVIAKAEQQARLTIAPPFLKVATTNRKLLTGLQQEMRTMNEVQKN